MFFSADTYAARRDRLRAKLSPNQVDGLLVTSLHNIRYLTGFTGSAATLLIDKKSGLLLSDARYEEQIQQECLGLEAYIRPTDMKLSTGTINHITQFGWKDVAFEASHISAGDFETYRNGLTSTSWKYTYDWTEALRAIKDDQEVAYIREAIDIAQAAFDRYIKSLQPGDKEIQLYHRMEQYLREAGAISSSFHPIIGAGHRAALPHGQPTELKIGETSLLLTDWGAQSRTGYISDLTRTYSIRKKTEQRYTEVYQAVLEAQRQAASTLRHGIVAEEVDKVARAALEKAGFEQYFRHGLGHGIGLEVHEAPSIRALSTTVLHAGMIVTLEPGVYLPGWGGVRIEDNYLITKEGAESLSSWPKTLEETQLHW